MQSSEEYSKKTWLFFFTANEKFQRVIKIPRISNSMIETEKMVIYRQIVLEDRIIEKEI